MMTGIIIQARCGSSRLPNKMVLPFYQNQSILSILLSRLKKKITSTPIIVATTTNPKDNLITAICKQHNIPYYRGSENDVLQRFIDAAEFYGLNKVIRICADNPFLALDDLQQLIETITTASDDYIAFVTSQGIPTIKTHYGFWGAAVTLTTLNKIKGFTSEPSYHEHVTNFIYSHPELFQISYLPIPIEIETEPLRLTVDTEEDFKLQQQIFTEAVNHKIEFIPENIVKIIKKHPDYFQIMAEQIKKNSK